MDKMTDSKAVKIVADAISNEAYEKAQPALQHIAARLREPAGVGGEFDAEAVAWAYGKLRDFGCYTSEAGAMMGDRLNMMLLDPPAAPHPPAEAQAQGGGDMTECGHSKYDPCHNCEPLDAPPSAPVGVEGLKARAWGLLQAEYDRDYFAGNYEDAAIDAIIVALAQQPAAVDGAMERLLTHRDWRLWQADLVGGQISVERMRAILSAALAAQPGGSDNDR